MALVQQDGSEVGVVSSHLDVVVVVVAKKQDIRKAVAVGVDHQRHPGRETLRFPGQGVYFEVEVALIDQDGIGKIVRGKRIGLL